MLTNVQHATIQFKVLNTTDTTANHADNVKPLNVFIAKRYFTDTQEGSITDLIASMHTAYNPKTKAFTFFTDKTVIDWALEHLSAPFVTTIPGSNRTYTLMAETAEVPTVSAAKQETKSMYSLKVLIQIGIKETADTEENKGIIAEKVTEVLDALNLKLLRVDRAKDSLKAPLPFYYVDTTPKYQMDQVQWTRFYKYRAIYLPSGSAADIKYAPDALKYHDLCPKCLRLRRSVDYDTECGSCSCGEKKRKAVGGPSADLEALLAAN